MVDEELPQSIGNKVDSVHKGHEPSSSLFDSLGILGKAAQAKYQSSGISLTDSNSKVTELLANVVSSVLSVEKAIRKQTSELVSVQLERHHQREEDDIKKHHNPDAVAVYDKDGEKKSDKGMFGMVATIAALIPEALIAITPFLPEIIAMVAAAVAGKLLSGDPTKEWRKQVQTNVHDFAEDIRKGAKATVKEVGKIQENAQRNLKDVKEAIEGVSSSAVALVKHFEGFQSKAYHDVNHFRAGYGSDTYVRDGKVYEVKKGDRVTRAEAEADLARRIPEFQATIRKQIGTKAWDNLNDNEKAALTSVAYNYGSLPKDVAKATKTGDAHAIAQAIRHHAHDNRSRKNPQGVNYTRRMLEADIVENSRSIPHATAIKKPPTTKDPAPNKPRSKKGEHLRQIDDKGHVWGSDDGSEWKLIRASSPKPSTLENGYAKTVQTNNITNNNTVVAPGISAPVRDAVMSVRPPNPNATWGKDYHTYFGTLT